MFKILIADDEHLEREALADIVARRFGPSVDIHLAENGRQAADIAVLWGADLILMDIEMPGQSGLDAARATLAQLPKCKVIFITAYSVFQYAHEAVHLGASDYLLKPVAADDAEAAIRRALRQIETERQLASLAPEEPKADTAEGADAAAEPSETADAPEGTAGQHSQLMQHVKRYLNDNYMYDLSLDSIADILKISPAYFSTLFKRYLGVNFVDYLTEVRINAAKELLCDPLRATSEVAGLVGYEDANYFSKAFKKRTGLTPTQYRRAGHGGAL